MAEFILHSSSAKNPGDTKGHYYLTLAVTDNTRAGTFNGSVTHNLSYTLNLNVDQSGWGWDWGSTNDDFKFTLNIGGNQIVGYLPSKYEATKNVSVLVKSGSVPYIQYDNGTETIALSIVVEDSIDASYTFGDTAGSTTMTLSNQTKQYTISYDANGGSGAPSSQTKTHGSNLQLHSTIPIRKGYTFLGWALTEAEADKGEWYYGAGYYTGKDENLNLYAAWTQNVLTINYYTNLNNVTVGAYSDNGGSTVQGTHPTSTKIYTGFFAYGKTYPAGINNLPMTATGYTMTGNWGTTPDGGRIVHHDTAFTSGQALAEALGTSLETGNATVSLYAAWQIKTYTNIIEHWAYGWKNGEGNNGAKDSFKLDEDTFTCQYGSSFELSASRGTTIPNGFYLYNVGTSAVTDSWQIYSLGTKLTQQAKAMGFQYFYHPYTYTITYNLEGGAFDSAPPTTYNVLYPVLFPTPKRAGYSFVGWYVDGWDRPVSGVNVGVNASFTSAEDLYAKLATRTTGNVTVTARWAGNGTAHVKQDGIWKKGQVWFKHIGSWKRGIPWVKVNGEWKKGGA